MAQLGIPASVVTNMLYKQIIMTKGIPFTLTVPNIQAACGNTPADRAEESTLIRDAAQAVYPRS